MKKIRIAWYHFHGKHLQKRKLRFVTWLDKKYPGKYCWADCVSWSIDTGAFNPFKIDRSGGCLLESIEHSTGACYCGAWIDGKCFDLLSEQERKEITDHLETVEPGVDDFPF